MKLKHHYSKLMKANLLVSKQMGLLRNGKLHKTKFMKPFLCWEKEPNLVTQLAELVAKYPILLLIETLINKKNLDI